MRDHEQASVDELARHLVAWEQDIPHNDVAAADVTDVKTTLVHTHLPKLDDYGLVNYDRRSEAVSYTHPPSLLDDALDLAATIENPP